MSNSGVTKRVINEFRLNQTEFNNKLLFIKRKLNGHLKKNGIPIKPGQSFPERVHLFRQLADESPYLLGKYECYYWLFSIWDSGNHSIIKKNDPLNFYFHVDWRRLRRIVLDFYGPVCMKCGSKERICIDHIKPRSIFPELELEFENLQVLCIPCNSSKSNRHIIDYRKSLNNA